MLKWRPQAYPGDRIVALSGRVEVGAVFPPIGNAKWRWTLWITHPAVRQGTEKTELAAKIALDHAWAGFLQRADLSEAA